MIRIRGLRKTFGERAAIDGLDLDVAPGEVFALLGPNGAGKSTTVSCATGVLAPSSGTIELFEAQDPSDPVTRCRIGVAPQALALHDELRGRDNVRYFGRLQGLSGAELKRAADAALDAVGLLDRADDRTGGYSGGMKRRLNLACALVHDPELLFLDEPTAGVDPQSRNLLFEVVQRLHEQGRTVVYTTHAMEEAERLCDRIAIIDHGRCLAVGTLDELIGAHGGPSFVEIELEDPATRTADLPEPNDDGVIAVAARSPAAELTRLATNFQLKAAQVRRPNLEHVFLELTGRELRDED